MPDTTENTTENAQASVEIKESAPIQFTEVGEVIAVDPGTGKFEGSMAIELATIGGEAETIFMSESYFIKARMDKWLLEGAYIQITFEKVVADKTTYEVDGVLTYHTKSNARRFAKLRRATKSMINEAKIASVINNQDLDDVSVGKATIIAAMLKA